MTAPSVLPGSRIVPCPHDVVDDDHAARADEPHALAEVLRARGLVGVDEREVERALEGREGVAGGPDAQVDHLSTPGADEVGRRDLGVVRVDLAGHQLAVGGSARASQIVE